MKKDKLGLIIIIVSVVIGLILRLLYINSALWYDEACSYTTAIKSFPLGITDNLLNLDLQHTPLYFFLLHFWMKLFGSSETVLRTFSLIIGLGTIPLTYIVTEKLATKRAAIFTSLAAAINPLLVIFGVEVRMYILAVFLVLLSLNYLTDFEQKSSKKSLIFLCLTNILIPYTLVGAIFYNLFILIFYGIYLYKNKREDFNKYRIFALVEWFALIPYFVLIIYYAMMRRNFVIAHEGNLIFFNIIDVIRNFFGTFSNPNVYWPASEPYNLTFVFCLFVIVPCVYFVYGYIKGFRASSKFSKVIYNIFLAIFVMAIIFAMMKVNVFTSRYLLYILIPFIILAVIGLEKSLNNKHFIIFLSLYLFSCSLFNITGAKAFISNKEAAFKTVANEAKQLELMTDDVVIMPFGSDADYYFKDISMPKLFFSDFHKTVRNPYGSYYDEEIGKLMTGDIKYETLYNAVSRDSIFNKNYYDYFMTNVNSYVPSGRYALVAMYDSDVNAIVSIEQLRSEIKDEAYLKNNFLDVLFKKYMCDVIAMLNLDFNFIKSYKQGNYTYILFQKK